MKKNLFVLFLACAAFVACRKDKKENGDGGNPGVVKYLTKMTETDSDGQSISTIFTWDGKNQLTNVKTVDGANRQFTYDGGGKITNIKTEIPDTDDVEEYTITYTAAGLPEKYVRRVKNEDGSELTYNGTYTLTGGKVSRIHEKSTDPANKTESFVDITYTGNNVTQVSGRAGTNGQPDQATEVLTSFTYGTKRNALAGMNLKYVLTNELAVEAYSANELKSFTLKFLGNTSVSNATYQYDAAGYPTASETKEEDSDEVWKYKYEYK